MNKKIGDIFTDSLELLEMDAFFHWDLYHINLFSSMLRLLLSMLLSGILGIERGKKNRPAGFRTYMVVSIGSTLAMLTNQYIMEQMTTNTDPTRIAAQVISGIGFLGAGTIIVTGKNQVRGLTTAAGLWASACIGIAVGCGYYEGAILGCACLFAAMQLLHSFDVYLVSRSKVMTLYIEFQKISDISRFLEFTRTNGITISDIEINKLKEMETDSVSALVTISLGKGKAHSEIIETFGRIDGVRYIEEVK